ncbi:MAG: preprotein translocase subunit SecY, partial [Polaribacter sp.]
MKFINTLKDIFKIEELKNKILLTIGLIAVYRFMAAVPLPGIDPLQLSALKESTSGGLLGLLNAFTGGAFARASVMALGIMPYISASIVVQLMGIAVPYLQKLQKDGESGRKKITQITRWLTIGITLVQAPTYITAIKTQFNLPPEAFLVSGITFWISSIIILTAGTIFAMWLGERITDKGIGNGISLLITVGIIANFPAAFLQEFVSKTENAGAGGLMMVLIEIIVWFVVILLTVLLVTAVRKIAVQYARRTVAGSTQNVAGSRDYIPLKLNAAGVMPIIFAQAIMFLPLALGQKFPILVGLTDPNGWQYNVIFAVLIIIFSYFYTAITIPTNKMA